MRKLALALTLLPLAACSTFSWGTDGDTLTKEQRERGIKPVSEIASAYETQSFFRSVRQRVDGRNNAFGRDLMSIADFFDRHLWNYNSEDPGVNYPSDTTKIEHLGRFGLTMVTSVPGVDELTNR